MVWFFEIIIVIMGSSMKELLRGTFRALKYRNYRLFFAGQSISLIGTWIQMLAVGWLAFKLTGSAFILGSVAFSSQIPSFLLAPFAGVLVDRWNKQKVLIATQTISLFQALALSVLVLSDRIEIWHLFLLGAVLGLVNSIDMPARQSFVVHMVDRSDIGNAIALNSSMVNSARLIGPAVAGILIASFGEGYCFLINTLSYIAVIISLFLMKVPKEKEERLAKPFLRELMEGLSYAFNNEAIRDLILLLGTVSLAGMPYAVLMPIFAKNILHGGPQTLGFLMSGAGIGALFGGLFLASRKSIAGLNGIMNIGTALFGAGLIAFSASKVFWLSLILMPVVGFGMLTQIAASNTILQTIVPDDKRGRIMSLYAVSFLGMAPFGSMLAGTLAHNFGAPAAVMVSGAICLLASAVFYIRLPYFRAVVRPIYIEKGVLQARSLPVLRKRDENAGILLLHQFNVRCQAFIEIDVFVLIGAGAQSDRGARVHVEDPGYHIRDDIAPFHFFPERKELFFYHLKHRLKLELWVLQKRQQKLKSAVAGAAADAVYRSIEPVGAFTDRFDRVRKSQLPVVVSVNSDLYAFRV